MNSFKKNVEMLKKKINKNQIVEKIIMQRQCKIYINSIFINYLRANIDHK